MQCTINLYYRNAREGFFFNIQINIFSLQFIYFRFLAIISRCDLRIAVLRGANKFLKFKSTQPTSRTIPVLANWFLSRGQEEIVVEKWNYESYATCKWRKNADARYTRKERELEDGR